jgi:hypothetical protein
MPLTAPDFERVFAPGTRHTLPDGAIATVRLRQDTSLWLPSGRVIAGEPFTFVGQDSADAFVQRVPPGQYPLVLVLAVFERDMGEMIAAARLVIRDEPVVSWEMAVSDGLDVSELDDDGFFGYPVDGGTGGFVDAATSATLVGDDDDYNGYIDQLQMSMYVDDTDYTAPGTLTDDEGRTVVVAFTSGDGDGHYPTWVGRTADGEVACFLTDFFVLTNDDDTDDGAADENGGDDQPSADGGESYGPGDFAQGDQLRAGQTLRRQSLTSSSGRYTFVHQDDGNLVLYDNETLRSCWASGTNGTRGSLCALRARDGLVLLDPDGVRVWATGADRRPARLVVRDDGDLVVEDAAGVRIWSSGPAEVAAPTGPVAIGDRMLPGQTLGRQSLTSSSGRYTFVHQDDGNLVLYDNEGRGAVWSSGTQRRGTARCVLQEDGNFVLYDRRARIVWSTDTAGHPGSTLVVHDHGVALRAPDGDVLWSARAAFETPATP